MVAWLKWQKEIVFFFLTIFVSIYFRMLAVLSVLGPYYLLLKKYFDENTMTCKHVYFWSALYIISGCEMAWIVLFL